MDYIYLQAKMSLWIDANGVNNELFYNFNSDLKSIPNFYDSEFF